MEAVVLILLALAATLAVLGLLKAHVQLVAFSVLTVVVAVALPLLAALGG